MPMEEGEYIANYLSRLPRPSWRCAWDRADICGMSSVKIRNQPKLPGREHDDALDKAGQCLSRKRLAMDS